MIYEVAAIISLAQQCAPDVATQAIVPLIMTESGGDTLAINVNKGPRVRAGTAAEGAALVRRYMAAGYTVDAGLAQINSANFSRLGIVADQVFDPCTNLQLASTILQENFGLASRHYSGVDAISATYSLYNTGTLTGGFRNGYVARVWSAASAMGSVETPPPLPVAVSPATDITALAVSRSKRPENWVVGQIASNIVEVFP